MNFNSDLWTDDKKQEWADTISTRIVDNMTTKDLERFAFDIIADDLFSSEWSDVWEQAEEYCPELIEASLEDGSDPFGSPLV
jgi:hypothetical protein